MHKSAITEFISKYTINKIDDVIWEISSNKIHIRYITVDKSMIGHATMFNFTESIGLEGNELGIYETSKLLKMLAALEDDITISPVKSGDKIVSLEISDGTSMANFSLSDASVIHPVPPMKRTPDSFEVLQMKVGDELGQRFLRAKAALPEVVLFSIKSLNENTVEIILGQTNVNGDYFSIKVNTIKNNVKDIMFFNALIFSDILVANKGMDSMFEISNEGLARIKYETKEYNATYYLVAKKDN
jgi:hypothetical protein